MNNIELEQLEKQEFDFLDTKDLSALLTLYKGKTICEFMEIVEGLYEQEYLKANKNDAYLFNVIDDYEFEDYLKKKYDIKTREEVVTNIYIC